MARTTYEDSILTMAYIHSSLHPLQKAELTYLKRYEPRIKDLHNLLMCSKYVYKAEVGSFACLMGLQQVGPWHFNAWLASTDELDKNMFAVLKNIRAFEKQLKQDEGFATVFATVPSWFKEGERLAEYLGFKRDDEFYKKDI